jgi:hypothetical protein
MKMSMPIFLFIIPMIPRFTGITQQASSGGRRITLISPLFSYFSLGREGALSMTRVPFLSMSSYFTELSLFKDEFSKKIKIIIKQN